MIHDAVAVLHNDLRILRSNLRKGLREAASYIFVVFSVGSLYLFYTGAVMVLTALSTASADHGSVAAAWLMARFLDSVAFFSFVSGFLNAVTSLYLAEDLPLLASLPLSTRGLYLARALRCMLLAVWMAFTLQAPFMAAYIVAMKLPLTTLWWSVILGVLPCAAAAAVGVMAATVAVRLIPPARLRRTVTVLALLSALGILAAFRLLRIEEVAAGANLDRFIAMAARTSAASLISPGAWTLTLLTNGNAAASPGGFVLPAFLAALLAPLAALPCIGLLYHPWALSDQSAAPAPTASPARVSFVTRLPGFAPGSLAWKDAITFTRSPQYRIHGVFVLAMAALYIFSLSLISGRGEPGLLGVLNLMLAGSVISLMGVRILLPLINAEGRAAWILFSAPRSLTWLVKAKHRQMARICLLLSMVFLLATAGLAGLSPVSLALTAIYLVLVSSSSSVLAVWMGSRYVDFTRTDPSMIAAGLGGILYTSLSVLCSMALSLLFAYPILLAEGAELPGVDLPPFPELAAGMVVAAVIMVTTLRAAGIPLAVRSLARRTDL